MQQTLQSRRFLRFIPGLHGWRWWAAVGSSWAFFILWVALTPEQGPRSDAPTLTRQRLADIASVLNAHLDERQFVPFTLREAAIYALGKGQALSLYDGHGQRLRYYALTMRDWLVHGFSADGFAAKLDAPAVEFATNAQASLAGLSFIDQHSFQRARPHASLGEFSPDGKLLAKLYHHPLLEKSWLVVHELGRKRFTMQAFHERVEEFLWLPGSRSLIFVATQSQLYQDGVYLWDLASNTTTNLLAQPEIPGSLRQAASDHKGWYLKLAGLVPPRQELLVWAMPRHLAAVPPELLFRSEHLLSLSLPAAGPLGIASVGGATKAAATQPAKGQGPPYAELAAYADPAALKPWLASLAGIVLTPHAAGYSHLAAQLRGFLRAQGRVAQSEAASVFDLKTLLRAAHNAPCLSKDPLQRQWCELPWAGRVDDVMAPWQNFVEESLETPLFAYGLWVLAFMYHDAYRLYAKLPAGTMLDGDTPEEKDPSKTAEVLRAYSTELARALLEYPLASAWQKATIGALWHALTSEEEKLNFELAKFQIDPRSAGGRRLPEP